MRASVFEASTVLLAFLVVVDGALPVSAPPARCLALGVPAEMHVRMHGSTQGLASHGDKGERCVLVWRGCLPPFEGIACVRCGPRVWPSGPSPLHKHLRRWKEDVILSFTDGAF